MGNLSLEQADEGPSNLLGNAVLQNSALSREGLLERLFMMFFDQLVYAQIWEDPAVDMEAMAIEPGQHLVTIALGGCNLVPISR